MESGSGPPGGRASASLTNRPPNLLGWLVGWLHTVLPFLRGRPRFRRASGTRPCETRLALPQRWCPGHLQWLVRVQRREGTQRGLRGRSREVRRGVGPGTEAPGRGVPAVQGG